MVGREESKDPIAGGRTGFLLIIINKTNRNRLANRQGKARQGKARQGKARQGKARQGRTQDIRCETNDDEPTRNCKHKEIIKGANEEGNEGEQLGKMYQ